MTAKIADLSKYRPIVDMKKAVDDGLIGFITKATEGLNIIDPVFVSDMALAKQYGVMTGAFHFGRSNNPTQEADFFLKTIAPYDNEKFLCALDLEASMSIAQAEVFSDRIFSKRGIRPVIYTRKTYVESLISLRGTSLSLNPLWVASYQNSPSWPRQWATWAIHQYSNGVDGPLPHGIQGIRDDIDMDRFNPLLGDLATWWGTDRIAPVIQPLVADKFIAPIGPDQLQNGFWRPFAERAEGGWYDANPYGTLYELNGKDSYHTGADLNLPNDADAHKPVLAVASAVVIFADRIVGSSWGNIIVLESHLPDGSKVWFRYAHLDVLEVKYGDIVTIGQEIARVGNAFGLVAFHLHFDVSLSGVLSQGFDGARDWPGTNLAYLHANYSDSFVWLKPRIQGPITVPTPTPPDPTTPQEKMHVVTKLNLRADHTKAAAIVETLAVGIEVVAGESFDDGAFLWRHITVVADGRSGWSAQTDHLTPWLVDDVTAPAPPPVVPPAPTYSAMFVTGNANLRQEPKTSSADIGDLEPGQAVEIRSGSDTLDPVTGITYVAVQSPAGWMSKKLVATTYTTAPPPVVVPPSNPAPVQSRSKMTVHLMPGASTGVFFALLQTLVRARKALRGVLLCRMGWDGEATPTGIKQNSPTTEVILRHYDRAWDTAKGVDWTYEGGRQWMTDWYNEFIVPRPENRAADYVQILNEPTYFGVKTADFWTGALDRADELGLRLAIGGFARGTPPLPNEAGGEVWTALHTVLLRIMKIDPDGKPHGVLLLHQYLLPDLVGGNLDEEWSEMRHKQLIAELPADVKHVPIRMGEFLTGYAAHWSSDAVINAFAESDRQFSTDPSVEWAAAWTLDGGGAWGDSLLGGHMARIQAYLVAFSN